MTKYPNPIPGDLLPLIDDIYQAKILLPDFQRGFDWNNKGVIDLLVSLLSGYFIGTFLVQRRGNGFDFAIRYFEGVPDVNSSLPSDPNTKIVEENVTQVVLDGQQRLRAILDFMADQFAIDGKIEPLDKKIQALDGLTYSKLPDAVRQIGKVEG